MFYKIGSLKQLSVLFKNLTNYILRFYGLDIATYLAENYKNIFFFTISLISHFT
jgi:hypothetical protein